MIILCWSVVQLRETRTNGKRKRLDGKFMISGTESTFELMVRTTSGTGFSPQCPAQAISRNEWMDDLLRSDRSI
ncbi:hypothetical protein niasHT_033845 [Heterodera trifolii]|uniref:Uncharacterized protein n=1 Tax=Heterodera trifolii TaxID=157864 RepID=A0ABD2I818_9BILA